MPGHWQAATNPSNSGRNSPVRQKFSGCHCTPRQKRAAVRSIASMTPSGAVGGHLEPVGQALHAWWWRLFTSSASPSIERSRISVRSTAAGDDPHLVGDRVLRVRHRVRCTSVGDLRRDVLHQRAAGRDVQHLHAAADRQHRARRPRCAAATSAISYSSRAGARPPSRSGGGSRRSAPGRRRRRRCSSRPVARTCTTCSTRIRLRSRGSRGSPPARRTDSS